jgi:uncharacterized protein YndB with AHSA1/START domain
MPDTLHVAMTGATDITFTRQFNASPALLWRAITDPAIIPRWLWAQDWPMVDCTMDLRQGGAFRWVWRTGPDRLMGVSGRFLAVDAPRHLSHSEIFDEDWTGGETIVTQDLTEVAPQTTRLTMVVHYATEAARAGAAASGMVAGMEEGYAKLDALLPRLVAEHSGTDFRLVAEGDRKIVVTRSFAAPKTAVFRAHTEAALLRRWMGSPEIPLEVCEMDPRAGGLFRYIWTMQDGSRITLAGTIRSISPDQIATTEVFDPDWTGGPAEVLTSFSEAKGQTTVRVEITYSATPARDTVLGSGMGEGMAGSYALLEVLLAEPAP